MDQRSQELKAPIREAIAALKAAIGRSEASIEDAASYCGVPVHVVGFWMDEGSTPEFLKGLLLRGYLYSVDILPTPEVEPGDILTAIGLALSQKEANLATMAEIVGRSQERIITDWLARQQLPTGLERIRIETALWERGWMEPEYLHCLDDELVTLAWALSKGCLKTDRATKELGISLGAIVHWISSRDTKPSTAARRKLTRLLKRTKIPPMPKRDEEVDLDAFEQVLRQVDSTAEKLLKGSANQRRKMRERMSQLVFGTSNRLNNLCSETARLAGAQRGKSQRTRG